MNGQLFNPIKYLWLHFKHKILVMNFNNQKKKKKKKKKKEIYI